MPVPHQRPFESDFAGTRARTVTLPASSASPWLSRQLLAQWCREWSLTGPVVDEAMVVLSELVTSCVASGAPVVSLTAALGEDQLVVSVAGSAGAVESAQDDSAERRMEIIRGLGSSVEVRRSPEGRTVVVAVPLSRAP